MKQLIVFFSCLASLCWLNKANASFAFPVTGTTNGVRVEHSKMIKVNKFMTLPDDFSGRPAKNLTARGWMQVGAINNDSRIRGAEPFSITDFSIGHLESGTSILLIFDLLMFLTLSAGFNLCRK